jgi:chemosensory pili system protein ChpA (sensor histidine kinase/response regulator)
MALTVLAIEDDKDVRDALQRLLTRFGYDVVTATDGASAIRAVQQRPVHVILVDLGLPGGDGFTVIERIRRLARYKGVPIIVLTGQASEANRARATQAGATSFLSKPPDGDELVRAIEQATGRPRPKAAGQEPSGAD